MSTTTIVTKGVRVHIHDADPNLVKAEHVNEGLRLAGEMLKSVGRVGPQPDDARYREVKSRVRATINVLQQLLVVLG